MFSKGMRAVSLRLLGASIACGTSCAAMAQEAPPPQTPAAETVPSPSLPPVEVISEAKKPVVKKKPAKKKAPAANTAETYTPPPSAAAEPTGLTAASAGGVSNAAGPIQDYIAAGSTAGTKTDTPLKETPQSISVIGKEQIRDQGAQTLQEATRYVPGVFSDPYGFDSRGDSTIIRGIPATYFVDGLRTTYGYSQTTVPIEPYALERIEVLRGPASMLYGQAPTGGIVNAVSKLPSDIAYNEIGIDYGSFDFKQVRFDSTGALTADGKWLYRVTGLVRDAETQVDYVDNDRVMIQPSLTYRPTTDTSITLLGHIRNDQSGSTQQFMPAEGTLFPNTVTGERLRRSTFGGEPGDYYDTKAQSISAIIDHKFNDSLKLHHISRYAHAENGYDSTYAAIVTPARLSAINGTLVSVVQDFDPSLPSDTALLNGANAPFLNANRSEVARARTLTFQDTDIFNTDTNLTAKFGTGWINHTVTGGVDYMRFVTDQANAGTLIDNLLTPNALTPAGQLYMSMLSGAFGFGGGLQPAFNIYNPTYGQSNYLLSLTDLLVSADSPTLTARPTETQTQTGIYIQDQIKAGPWVGVFGLRHDWLTAEADGSADENHTATTGRAALMYNFDFGLTPYVSYSTSFSPLPGQPVGGDILAPFTQWRPAGPIKGEQVEIGFKYQPYGAPFMINASVYELTERNQIVQPDVLFAAVQGADIKSRGFELEAIGKITPELKVIGAYSYTDAEYDKYPELYPFPSGISEFMVGKRVDGIPEHMASLWAIYSVLDGPLRGLSFGAGARYVGGSESSGRDIATGQEIFIETPSFTLFDAMVAYETKDWRWQLTGQNLEDEYVVTSCAAYRGDCFLGQGRTIITGFTYKF